MTIRKIASTLFAALLVSASFAAAASAATARNPIRHPHSTMRHPMRGRSAMRQDSGSAATDALNQQSLSSARSGMAPGSMAPGSMAPGNMSPTGTPQ